MERGLSVSRLVPTAISMTLRALDRADVNTEQELQQPATCSLRKRKVLPPLAKPPTEERVPEAPVSMDGPLAAAVGIMESKAEIDQLLRNHVRFANALKLNDPAVLMSFLDKDVRFTTHEGVVFEGVSAALGGLVGDRMTKLSAHLHVKGQATRTGPWQSTFVYEHGVIIKQPLFSELLEWKPHSHVITSILHTTMSNPGELSCVSKNVGKVVTQLPQRLSLGDKDEEESDGCSKRNSIGRRSSVSRTDSSSSTSSNVVVTRIAVLNHLTPIRKRKLVNPFVTIETLTGRPIWRSRVARRDPTPVWAINGVDFQADEAVLISLWDEGFFRSVRVASSHVVMSQLLDDDKFIDAKKVFLRPSGISSSEIEISLTVERQDESPAPVYPERRSTVLTPDALAAQAIAIEKEDHHEPFAFHGMPALLLFTLLAIIVTLWMTIPYVYRLE
ncbi:hypothetical protein Poli38472_013448 [Pythium oligandrum]|uniref:C2 domain-containing protein n=1 Tax=Pythium oligandrum TaxID=41045 RepID=A0A8K1FEI4_PYTOL|nr:hypothetical protein Poli38472_013448 [Pythium oligandrum]|eukprot:TMW57974.1 hypothetical protein Poli38472_013448 [Pythium oligandrum]